MILLYMVRHGIRHGAPWYAMSMLWHYHDTSWGHEVSWCSMAKPLGCHVIVVAFHGVSRETFFGDMP